VKRIGLFFLLAIAANAQSGPYVGLHNVAGNAGQSAHITVNLTNQGAQIAGLQFDLVYDKTAMSITAATGSAANTAGKFVATNSLSNGLRVIVTGFNQNLIGDGGVADLTIAISAGAATANYPLAITNTSATDASGTTVALGQLNGNLTVGNAPTLSVTKTHTGNFAQGQSSAAYTVTVSNQVGALATSGAVTVTENLPPSGLTLLSMAGNNWNCSAVTSCTRSDPLNGGASYDPITVTVSVAGDAPSSVTNSVTVSGGGSLDAFASNPTTINVPLSQTITFGPLTGVAFGVSPFTVGATASSGLPVNFTSTTSAVCTVSTSTVTIAAAGICSIAASQGGNGTYAPAATVTQSFTVSPAAQTINFTQPADTALNAGPVTLSATASSNLGVTFASTTTGVCTVTGSSVTLVARGSCTITASQGGNGNFNAAPSVNRTFNVLGNSNVITFPQPVDTGLFSGPVVLTATANSGLAVSYGSNSTTVCTVAGSSVTLLTVGSCSITASQDGDGNFAAAATVTKSFNVLKGSQTITFGPLSNVTFGVSPFSVTASASSTLAVSLASNTTSVCTVSSNTVTIVAAGTCSLTATQPGDGRYAAAPSVNQTFTVAQGSQTITFNALGNTTFGTAPFSVSATASSTLLVSFSSSTSSVCTVSGSVITLAGVGTCSIAANQAGNTNVSAAPTVTQNFTVAQGSQTITFGPLSGVAKGIAPFTVSATASSGLAVTFASTTQAVCTVQNSQVTIVDVGTCSITASQGGNTNYLAASDVTQSFTVAPGSQTITFGPLSGVTFGAAPFTLTATASSGLTVSFASTTQTVCTVSVSTVTIAGAGTCSITASQAGNTSFGAATPVVQSFTVAKAAQTITFAGPPSAAVGAGPLTLSATASSNLAVAFASSTSSVCTVSDTTLTIVAAGNCTVTASQAGDTNYLAATAVPRTFTVSKGTQTITFGALSNVAFGVAPITLTATASSGLTVAFASTTSTVCSVSGTTLTILKPGSCSVTASQAGNGNYTAATSVPQSFSVAAGTQTITFNALSNATFGAAPFTISATASSNLPVSFASTTTDVCTVAVSTVTLKGAGTCSITASQAGNTNFAAATSVVQSFTVAPGSQTITFGPLSGIALGQTPAALSATASSGLAVSFASNTAAACTVQGTTITLVDVGTCSITASQAGNANYNAATSVTQTFSIAPGSQTITFPQPAGVVFGVAPFTLTASSTSHLTLAFSSTTLTVCTVSGSTVTILATGTCSITADQAGNSSFSAAAPVSRSFSVSLAPQTITFVTPDNVVMGVTPFAISATASSGLDVTFASTTSTVCTVSGSTVTVVGAGTCSVTASQAGGGNYLAASSVSRSFTVAKGPQTITFAALSDVAFGVAPITLTATSSAGLTVTFSSSTLTVCTVSGTTLTVVGPGNCSVSADQAGDTNYQPASSITRTFIATGTQTITFPPISDQALGTPPFELGGTSTSGLPVSYASTTQSVCTVSGTIVTLLAQGTCSITASQAGNSIFLPGTATTLSFTVVAPPPCEYNLSPGAVSVSASGGTGVLKVLTGAGCSWTATPNAEFISLSSAASGTDSSSISYTVAANSGASRTGTITVSGQTFTVNQFGTTCSFALSTPVLDFTAAGGSAVVSVFAPASNCSWTATPGDPAVTLSSSGGTAPSQITVSLTANPNTTARNLTADIGGQTLAINQPGKNCTVTLGASTATISAAGGPGSVSVTTQSGCSYSTVSGPSWINITSGDSGAGPGGVLFYTVDPNSTTVSRSGAMNIGGQFFEITQPGVSCEISLDTSLLGSPFASAGGTGSIGIITSNAACNWTASTRASWLSFSSATSGTGAGTVSVTSASNGSLSPRSASISIGGQLVNVSQAGTACAYALRSPAGAAPPGGGSGSVGVVSSPGCTWTSSSNASWLTINSSANNGTGDVAFTADANNTSTPRSGTLTIAGETYTVNQGAVPCDFNLALASVNIPVAGVTNSTVAFSTTAAGCAANAMSFSSWLTVSTQFSGQTGTISYTAAPNTGPARIGIVKLGDRTLSVNQAATSCAFTLASPGLAFTKDGGLGSIQLTAAGSGCTPSASSNQVWVTPGGLTGPVSNVFTQPYTVTSFISAANAVRTAKITIGGKTYTVKQTSW